MRENYQDNEIDRLAQRLRDDSLTPEEAESLRDVIRNHPRARKRLVRHLHLDAELRADAQTRELLPEAAQRNNIIAFGPWQAAAAAVAVLAVSATFFLKKEEPVRTAHLATPEETGVAVIGRQIGVVWSDETQPNLSRIGDRVLIEPGYLEISEGMLQVDFYAGASVLIEGPAGFEVIGAKLGRLHHGKISVHVPPPARGFKVVGPDFQVVDLGTEFGMEILPNGKSEVHVFDGEVEMHRDTEPTTLLKTGEGWALAEGESSEISAQPGEFRRSESMDEEIMSQMRRWEDWTQKTKLDPDVVLFFPFSDTRQWNRTIVNEAVSAPADSDGAIVGCQPVPGRWPGIPAMGFSSSSDRIRLNLTGEYDSLTLSAWVRIDRFSPHHVSLLSPDTQANRESFFDWSIIIPAGGLAVHTHASDTDATLGDLAGRTHYHSPENLRNHFAAGSWVHLALVFDSETGEVRHYANGTITAALPWEDGRKLRIGTMDIGNWPYMEWAQGTEFEVRNLNGALSDLLIAKRPFTDAEIQEIHSSGRP